ncbi:hypothetical protein MAQ5080_01537 [Marinomonas aquimarina]|uniref:DUF3108 domain-containing protein n=1 Tax=Marinomonas aquimarina TaxID=295068 RepID=A0A1A8TAK6_9GAMM|nr:hypothetical protein [Marinomonas aquimarina]SBS29909.1 hypothetical protein MAQ5080_01537 [Marinomonas aquimarina]
MLKLIAIATLSLCALQVSAQAPKTVIGEAYDSQSKQLLYVEKHRYVGGNQHEVKYYNPAGELFAEKLLRYGEYQQAPAFEQTNSLRGEWIKVSGDGDQLTVEYREKSDSVVFDKRIKVNEHLLVDAGFDRYVKLHWDALVQNQKREIEYLVPSRLTTVGFEVGRVECLSGTPEEAVCFAIAPTSWFVSLAVDPITVAYDPATQNLLRFNGRGNIASSSGKYQTVDIHYQYPE